MTPEDAFFHAERLDPGDNVARYYTVEIEPDLFGATRLVRRWGRIGTYGQMKVAIFADLEAAGAAFNGIRRRKLRRAYVPVGGSGGDPGDRGDQGISD